MFPYEFVNKKRDIYFLRITNDHRTYFKKAMCGNHSGLLESIIDDYIIEKGKNISDMRALGALSAIYIEFTQYKAANADALLIALCEIYRENGSEGLIAQAVEVGILKHIGTGEL